MQSHKLTRLVCYVLDMFLYAIRSHAFREVHMLLQRCLPARCASNCTVNQSYLLTCASTSMLRAGAWVDQFMGFGGPGGTPGNVSCPNPSIAVGFSVSPWCYGLTGLQVQPSHCSSVLHKQNHPKLDKLSCACVPHEIAQSDNGLFNLIGCNAMQTAIRMLRPCSDQYDLCAHCLQCDWFQNPDAKFYTCILMLGMLCRSYVDS